MTGENAQTESRDNGVEEYLRANPHILDNAARMALASETQPLSASRDTRQDLFSALVNTATVVLADNPHKNYRTLRSLLNAMLQRDRPNFLWAMTKRFGQVTSWLLMVLGVVLGGKEVGSYFERDDDLPLIVTLESHQAWSGRRLRIEGYEARARSKWAAQIVAFDADGDQSSPLWTSAINECDIPAELVARREQTYDTGQFAVRVLAAFDVFVDSPGEELVAVFNHNDFSQCCIRIIDSSGRTLWQAWHDGNVMSAYWVGDEDLLVLAGVNGEDRSEKRGLPKYQRNHPVVLIGIRPELDATAPRWINTVDHDGGISPVFYRCLDGGTNPRPIDAIKAFEVTRRRPGRTPLEDFRLVLMFTTPWADASYSFGVDVEGNEVPHSQIVQDTYARARDDKLLADPACYHLTDLPRFIVPTDWMPGTLIELPEQEDKDN